MSTRLRILAAASALGTFTAKELAAEAAAPYATVRNLLQEREPDKFAVVGEERNGRPGRPKFRYRLVDPAAIVTEVVAAREEIPEIDHAFAVADFGALHDEPGRAETEAALLDTAQRSLQRAAHIETEARMAAAGVASRAAEGILQSQESYSREMRQRAIVIYVCAEVLSLSVLEGGHQTRRLAQLATRLSGFFRDEPAYGLVMLSLISRAAVAVGQAPPLVVVAKDEVGPGSVFSGDTALAETKSELDVLWIPSYAAPLIRNGIPAGVVVDSRGRTADDVRLSLERFSEWPVPKVVAGPDDFDLAMRVNGLGAMFMPLSRGPGAIITSATRALQDRRLAVPALVSDVENAVERGGRELATVA